MADEKTAAPSAELETLAFGIYSQRVASFPTARGGEQEALFAFRAAETFLTVRKRVRSGEAKTKEPTGPQLTDCCAPNLKKTHPHNLVSQRFGDLQRVNRIKAWLDKNPTPEKEPDELTSNLNREFPDLGWDMPTINTARAIFPAYCTA